MKAYSRVLLIYPPSQYQRHGYCPSGILMVGTILDRAGHEVRLLDANAEHKPLGTEDIIQAVEEWKPDVIGITIITPLIWNTYRLVAGLKRKGAKHLAGGPHATILPEEALAHGFDAVVIGEGEITTPEAIEALCGRIPIENVNELAYLGRDGQPKRNSPRSLIPNLDDLPFPSRYLVNPLDYGRTEDSSFH